MNNHVQLIGRVGNSPKLFVFGENTKVVFSLAVKEFTKKTDEKGERIDSTLWVECQAWNKLAQTVMNNVTKGREVVVNGKLAGASTYTSKESGELRTVMNVRLSEPPYLCGKKPS